MSTDNKDNKKEQNIPRQEAASQDTSQQKAPWTAKRIAAIIGIVLLVALYVLTFVSSLIGTEGAGRLFRFSLGMTIAVPIFLWIFIWCIGRFQNKRNMASRQYRISQNRMIIFFDA